MKDLANFSNCSARAFLWNGNDFGIDSDKFSVKIFEDLGATFIADGLVVLTIYICKGRYRSDHQKSVPDQSHLHPSHWKQEISEVLPGEEQLGKPGKLNLLDFKEQDSVNCCVLCDMDYTAQYVQHINTAIRYQVWPLSRLVSVNLSSRHRFADLA